MGIKKNARSRKVASAERQIKLALTVNEYGPISRARILEKLPDYRPEECSDSKAASKAEAAARKRFERDRAELAARGIVIGVDNKDRYILLDPEDDSPFAQLQTGSPEAALLRAAGAALSQDSNFQQGEHLRMGLAKLSGVLEIPDELSWASSKSLTALQPLDKTSAGTRRKIESAIEALKLVSFTYLDACGAESRRAVEPIGLYTSNGRQYLAAWDPSVEEQRCFRLDRMGKVSVNESGRGGADFEPRPFDPEDWQLLPFQMGTCQPAKVSIDPCAQWQAHYLCAGHGSVDSDTWTVDCASPQRLAAWCVANGPGLVPLEPSEAVAAYWEIVAGAAGISSDMQSKPAGRKSRASKQHAQHNERARAGAALALASEDTLMAVFYMIEQAGSISIPQTALLLGTSEESVFDALESLAFCYDAVNSRLNLGERGCSFASLENPSHMKFALTQQEGDAFLQALGRFQRNDVARIVAEACSQPQPPCLAIKYWKEGAPAPEARLVEPQALLTRNGRSYLQAWCHSARGARLFRLDRIIEANYGTEEELQETGALCSEGNPEFDGPKIVEASDNDRAVINLAPGTPTPDWPGVTSAKKQAASGIVTITVPWFGSPWLAKQIASLGSQVLRMSPAKLEVMVRDYAQSLLPG